MPKNLRLSILIFFQFFSLGAIFPVLSLYLLNELKFSGTSVGIILSVSSFAGIFSPFIGSFIADRKISTERLFSFAHFCAGILLFFLYYVHNLYLFIVLYSFYAFFISSTVSLTNAIIFHHITDREKYYGKIRVMGTIGWIAVALFFSFVWQKYFKSISSALLLSSISSIFLSVYSFFLKSNKFSHKNLKKVKIFPHESFNVIKKKFVIYLIVINFFVVIIDRLNMYAISPYLKYIGVDKKFILPIMSIGQVSEIFAMILLARLIKKIGLKFVIVVGILFNLLRFGIYSATTDIHATIIGLFFHGLAYTFVSSALFILLDYEVDKKNRSGVHQLFNMISGGFGAVVGNMIGGFLMDMSVKQNNSYRAYWFITFLLTIFIFFLIIKLRYNRVNYKKVSKS